tara:strand:- start:263 stop:490 length:228 start_codon:yes stop_codon:yes gene_type:complete
MKYVKLLIIIFIFPLALINCSNQYDGGTYTGSSMSSKKTAEINNQETITIEKQITPDSASIQSTDQVVENEDNYK